MAQKFSYPIQTGQYTTTPPNKHWDNSDSVDFGVVEGTPLYAIANGEIILARKDRNTNTFLQGNTGDTGNCVVLKFNAKGGIFYATYMHMKEVFVNENDVVTSGQVIGLSGNTGYSDGAHLHIQIRQGNWYDRTTINRNYDLNKEKFRITPTQNTIGFTEKLFRYLEVQKNLGNENLLTLFEPTASMTTYYTENFDPSLLTDDDLSRLCQLCRNELGDIGDKNTQLMNFGVYSKLMRSIYMRHRNSNPGKTIIQILKEKGGFSGWGSRGYPLLPASYPYQTEIKEIVYNNLMNGKLYGLSGKFMQIASCYPLQNYGYAGFGYGANRNIESELENNIVNRNIESHITINSGTTRLIGCIANTGFFTTIDVIKNLNITQENKTLISQLWR